MLLTGVKNQAIMERLWFKTILRSPECISRDKLMAILKATLHAITKHRLPYWQLLILGNYQLATEKVLSLQCCYPWLSSTMWLRKNRWCLILNRQLNRTSWSILFNSGCLFQNRNRCHNPYNSSEMNILFSHSVQCNLSKSTWGKIKYDTISIPLFQKS